MSQPDERLRPHPSTRMTGPVVPLNLRDLARALYAEPHPAIDGHRQAGLIHRGPLRLLLFAFEPGAVYPNIARRATWSSSACAVSWRSRPGTPPTGSAPVRPSSSTRRFPTRWRRRWSARCC